MVRGSSTYTAMLTSCILNNSACLLLLDCGKLVKGNQSGTFLTTSALIQCSMCYLLKICTDAVPQNMVQSLVLSVFSQKHDCRPAFVWYSEYLCTALLNLCCRLVLLGSPLLIMKLLWVSLISADMRIGFFLVTCAAEKGVDCPATRLAWILCKVLLQIFMKKKVIYWLHWTGEKDPSVAVVHPNETIGSVWGRKFP